MLKEQRTPAASQPYQYEFAWGNGTPSPTPPPVASGDAPPVTDDAVSAPRDASSAIAADAQAPVQVRWDFRSSFPSPLPEAIDAGVLDVDDDDPDAIRSIHAEQAAECLALLREMDAIAAAAKDGMDPRTGKKPRTEKSRQRLRQYLDAAAPAAIRQFDDALAAYEDAFGPEAAAAFRTALMAWHRGVPVNSTATDAVPPAIREDPVASASAGSVEHGDKLDVLGGPMMPVATPLDCAVNQGVFGQDEDGNPVIPSIEEVKAITGQHADRLMDLLENLQETIAALAQASDQQRLPLVRAKDRAMSAYQSALQIYVEDFGERAARRLDAWVHHQVETQCSEASYDPGHPWHYLERGDGLKPISLDDIRPSDIPVDGLAVQLPKDRVKREKRLREMRKEYQARLEDDRRRYVQLLQMGISAVSDFDRNIAFAGDAELAWASAISLVYRQIRNGLAHLAWTGKQLADIHPEPDMFDS